MHGHMSQGLEESFEIYSQSKIHGNNDSMDGDPAAMRYAEARCLRFALSPSEYRKDSSFAWNFDDTEKPTVLPATFCKNLLINSSAIFLAKFVLQIFHRIIWLRVIDATVYMIDHPTAKVDKLIFLLDQFSGCCIIKSRDEIKKAIGNCKGVDADYGTSDLRW